MSVPINLRIKIVLLMAKFESSVVIRRKLQTEFSKDAPTEACIKRTHDRLCATDTAEDREHRKLQNKRQTKFAMSLKTNHNQVFVLLQRLVPFHRQQHAE